MAAVATARSEDFMGVSYWEAGGAPANKSMVQPTTRNTRNGSVAALPVEALTMLQAGRADVAELVDATDLKSVGPKGPCRFDSGRPHQIKVIRVSATPCCLYAR
jgi:hypothetical protein